MNTTGFFKVHRKMFISEVWRSSPPEFFKLWIWILGQAEYHKYEDLERGEFYTTMSQLREAISYRQGAVQNKVSPRTMRSYIRGLKDSKMIDTRVSGRSSACSSLGEFVLTVLNYSDYQLPEGDATSTVESRVVPENGVTPIITKNPKNRDLAKPEKSKKKPKRKKPKTPVHDCPPDLVLAADREEAPEKYFEWGKKKNLKPMVINTQFVKFVQHHIAKGNQWASWYTAWQKWIGNHVEWNKPIIQGTDPNGKGYNPDMHSEVANYRALGKTDKEIREMGYQI